MQLLNNQFLLTNFAKDLPHLLQLLFCYFSRHFSVIDLSWSVREVGLQREKVHTVISKGAISPHHLPPLASCKILSFNPGTFSQIATTLCIFNRRRDL